MSFKYVQVGAWFDEFESVNNNPFYQGQQNEDEDEDEEAADYGHGFKKGDMERLSKIKALLFRVHQQNIEKLRVSDFVKVLSDMCSMVDSKQNANYYQYLFE